MPAQELFRETRWEIRNKILLARARHDNDKVQAYPTIIAEHANNRHNNNNDKYANNER